jgi:hydrogenase maturation factor
MAGLDPLRALMPGEAVAPVDSDARTAAEQKLAMLLAKQAELANEVTDAGTARHGGRQSDRGLVE